MLLYWSYYPKLDLHGEASSTIYTLIDEFINDNIKLKKEIVVIIHGKGEGILQIETHKLLKEDKRVLEYNLDPDNLGQTIVKLDIK